MYKERSAVCVNSAVQARYMRSDAKGGLRLPGRLIVPTDTGSGEAPPDAHGLESKIAEMPRNPE